jgi:hypothetical protein
VESDHTWIFWVVAIIAGFLSWQGDEGSVGKSIGIGLVCGWIAYYGAGALMGNG